MLPCEKITGYKRKIVIDNSTLIETPIFLEKIEKKR